MNRYYQNIKKCQSYIEDNHLENEYHFQTGYATPFDDKYNGIVIVNTPKGPDKAPLYMTIDEFMKYCMKN